MPATGQDVVHYRGDDKKINVTIRNPDGTPAVLAGATAKWWMGKNANSKGTNVLIKKQSGSGLTLSVDGDGLWTAQVTIDPDDTQDLRPGQYYHELAVIDALSAEYTVTTGGFELVSTIIPPA